MYIYIIHIYICKYVCMYVCMYVCTCRCGHDVTVNMYRVSNQGSKLRGYEKRQYF